MIIRNNFGLDKKGFNRQPDYLEQEKIGLKKSIDNLDARYKKGEIDIEKFKKIAGGYAARQEDLNRRINNNR